MTFPSELRITQVTDEIPTPSFFIRFRDPIKSLTKNWNYVRSSDFDLAERIVGAADVVFFQRAFTTNSLRLLERAQGTGIPTIYETDDLLLDLPPQSGFRLNGEQSSAIKGMLAKADLVTCSTSPLGVRLSEYSSTVSVLENYAIPFEIERIREARSGPPHAIIVNTDYFKLVSAKDQLFKALQHAIENLSYSVTFLGSVDSSMNDLKKFAPDRVQVIPLFIPSRHTFLQRVLQLGVNVAIVPLENNVHHSFKSDIKFLDFGSIGVAGIYNNSQVYKRVDDQQNGFLCNGGYDGWVAGLEYFSNSETRDRAGDAAYECAAQRTLEHYARDLAAALLSLRAQHLSSDTHRKGQAASQSF